jgi:hypothetical protein
LQHIPYVLFKDRPNLQNLKQIGFADPQNFPELLLVVEVGQLFPGYAGEGVEA